MEKSAFADEAFLADAWKLIQRDEKETQPYGQNVRNSFPLADLFVNASSREDLAKSIGRFMEALFGHPFRTPTRDEFSMFHAYSSSLRSSDMGRQVGAVVATPDGQIVATGCNEVPKAGGGTYWEGDKPESRDFARGQDSSDITRRDTVAEIIGKLCADGLFDPAKIKAGEENKLVSALLDGEKKNVLRNAQVFNVIEYGRSVHAEMAALSDAAFRGVSAVFAKIAHMLRLVEIDDDDLELAERALHGLAHRYRQDAERTQNPMIRDGFEEHAKRCERIAGRIKQAREARSERA